MRIKLLIAVVLVACLVGGVSVLLPRMGKEEATVKVVGQAGGGVSQADIDSAWREALRLGHGNPSWPCPVTPDRVVIVPSTLTMGPWMFFGITNTEAIIVNGELRLQEVIEIHLNPNRSCHLRQVLIHELLHVVATRRQLADPTFAAEAMALFPDEEAWVRATYPVKDMGVCAE